MMNKRSLIALLLLVAFAFAAMGQTDEVPKPVKPKPKEHARFTLKSYYFSQDYYFKTNILDDLDYGEMAGLARHTNLGFSLKIPLGHVFFLQPEALFSLNTNWDDASLERGYFNEFVYGFRHRDGVNMDVPLYLGVKWSPGKLFAAKAYVGPMFHFGWMHKEFYKDFKHYSVVMGGGLELLNFLTLDGGYMFDMDGMNFRGSSQFFIAAGLLL